MKREWSAVDIGKLSWVRQVTSLEEYQAVGACLNHIYEVHKDGMVLMDQWKQRVVVCTFLQL